VLFLVGAARSARADSYEETCARLLGPNGEKLCRGALCVLIYGSLVSSQIIVADLASPSISAWIAGFGDAKIASSLEWLGDRRCIAAATLAAVYPLVLARSLSSLRSATSAAFLVIVAVVVAVAVAFATSDDAVDASVVASTVATRPGAIALALPVMALGFTCHFNVVDIDKEFSAAAAGGAGGGGGGGAARTNRDVHAVVHVSLLLVAFPIYALFACAGYFQYGASVSDDFLTEWAAAGARATTVAQVAVAGVNVLKYPLFAFGLRRNVEAAVDAAYGGWRATWRRRRAKGRARRRANVEDDETGSMLPDDEEEEEEEEEDAAAAAPAWAHHVALFLTHLSAAVVAIVCRELEVALDVVGATCGTLVTFILPGVLFLRAFDPAMRFPGGPGGDGLAWAAREAKDDDASGVVRARASAAATAAAYVLVGVGVAASVCGVVAVVYELA